MIKARNNNQDCAMCCNPTPTEVYKHLPGFVKLLCNISTQLGGRFSTNGDIELKKGSVTQITSPTTAVTANASAGVITTVSETLAAGASVLFTVNDSFVLATSVVSLTLDDSAITTGVAVVRLAGVTAGSFVIKVTNTHATQALNNVLKIHYVVL